MTSSNPIRVLIADHHPIVRQGLRGMLSEQTDIQIVAELDDGRDLLPAVELHEPDVLLSELQMPGMGGFAVLQQLQQTNSRTRVLLFTASEDRNDFVQAMRVGCSGVISKQSEVHLILKSIRKVASGEVWLDSHHMTAVLERFASPGDATSRPEVAAAESLSRREREIVGFIAQGYRNKEIAEQLFVSEQTVKNHLHNVFDKLGVSDRLELALYAISTGLTTEAIPTPRPNSTSPHARTYMRRNSGRRIQVPDPIAALGPQPEEFGAEMLAAWGARK